MIQDKQINGFSKLKSLPRNLSKWIHLLSNLKLLSTLTRQTTTWVLLIFSKNNLEVICYNPSIFIYARLMLSKHCFVNSMIISSPKLNLNISILLSLHKLEPNTIHYFAEAWAESSSFNTVGSFLAPQWCWYLWSYAGANMPARHNVYIFHCFTTLHPQGGLIINKLLLLAKFIILL